jgi:hypothetical protein
MLNGKFNDEEVKKKSKILLTLTLAAYWRLV